MSAKSSITQYLKNQNIPFEVFSHEAVFSSQGEEARFAWIGIPPYKNLVLQNRKKDRHFLFTVPGGVKTNLALINEIAESRLSFSGPEELLSLLQVNPGSCSPLGLIFYKDQKVEFWIEKSLAESPFLGFHPNDNTETWKIKTLDLQKFMESLGRKWNVFSLKSEK